MKTSIRHLPQHKQFELNIIKRTILEFCPKIEMIVLFGSYARGDWVEDIYQEGHITYKYQSDYDLLLVFNNEKEANNLILKLKLEKLIREAGIATYFSLIIHSIKFVNNKISHGNYFFTDIKKEGVMLFDSKNYKLIRRKKLNDKERQKYAQEDFNYWFKSANSFLIDYQHGFDREDYNKATFELHQATERYYHAILLVFTGYKHKTHNIEDLGRQAKNLNAEFDKVFPRGTNKEKYLFELLQKAYIDARYKPDYSIQKEELKYLGQRVSLLKELTERICKEKIVRFVGYNYSKMEINEMEESLKRNEMDFEIIHHKVAIKSKQDAIGIFKIEETAPTLILRTESDFYALIISGKREKINFKELKKLLGCMKLEMAKKEDIINQLGIEAGQVPMIGHDLPCIIDRKLLNYKYVYGGTGNWNYTLKINSGDLIRANNVVLQFD